MRRKYLIGLIACLAGCAATLPLLTQDDAQRAVRRWPDATLQNLNQGRDLYIDRCSGCHSLHPPDEYSEANWRLEIERMKTRARLTESQKELVLRYLILNSSENRNTFHTSP
jgi:hypothetical protein